MAYYFDDASRTFSEYLLIPNLTRMDCIPSNVSLTTPIVKFENGEKSALELKIPFVSAIMQSVSDDNLAIALAKCGGLAFVFSSQPIVEQVEMIKKVKKFKAGFVVSDANLTPEHTLQDVIALKERTGHSTIAITEDGSPISKLLGLVTTRDYRVSRDNMDSKIKEFMTPFSKLIIAKEGISLSEANDYIWEKKLNCLPIIDNNQSIIEGGAHDVILKEKNY